MAGPGMVLPLDQLRERVAGSNLASGGWAEDAEADSTDSEASAGTAESTAPGPPVSSDASSMIKERMSVEDRAASWASFWDGYESEFPGCENDKCPGGCAR